MALEIERKFLVVGSSWRSEIVESHEIRQGYLSVDPSATVRVRVTELHAYLTVKGAPNAVRISNAAEPDRGIDDLQDRGHER